MGSKTVVEKTDQTQNTNQQFTIPEWMSQGGQQVFNQAQNLVRNDTTGAQPYSGERSAGPSANQMQASQVAAQTPYAGTQDLNAARYWTDAAAQGSFGFSANPYYNPYYSAGYQQQAMPNFAQAAQQGYGSLNTPSTFAGAAQQTTTGQATTGQAGSLDRVGNVSAVAPAAAQTGPAAYGSMYSSAPWQQDPNAVPMIDPNGVSTGQFGLAAFNQYGNPYQQAVIQSTLDEMQKQFKIQDLYANDRAAQANAFGGARHGVYEALNQNNQNRQIEQYINSANAANWQQAQGQFNADQGRALQASGMNLQGQMANQQIMDAIGARNLSAQQAYDALYNQNSLANAGFANQFGLANAGFQQDANMAGAENIMRSQFANQNARLGENAAQFGAQNQFGLANLGYQNQFGMANMDAYNAANAANAQYGQQAGLANMDAYNQFAQARSDIDRYNTGSLNQFGLANQDLAAQIGQYNTGLRSATDQFNTSNFYNVDNQNAQRYMDAQALNASLYGQDLNRLLAAGQQYQGIGAGDVSANETAVNNLMKTGIIDQQVNQQALDAQYQEFLRTISYPYDQYNFLAGILSGVPYNKSVTGTANTHGTTTSTESGGLLGNLLGAATLAASFI